ncbi:hypothetical protein LCGC14_2383780 [marine sediment metagenome]|uniref:Uncharacterized protein n=1 Tax=marine sediment metagenome TaxID=412755 RepID=A0A0F9C065_9ZZZZ
MAHTNAWSNIVPAGSDNLNTADDQIRRLRLDIQERGDEIVDDWTADPVVPKKLDVSRVIGTPDLAVVYTGAAFAIPTGTVTTIDFVQETLDTGGFHDNSVNPSRLTITTAAYYRIHANLQITFTGAAALCHIRIRKNGADLALGNIAFLGAGVIETISITYIDLAAATDYYEIVIQNPGSGSTWNTLDEADEAYFMIERLVGTI